MTARTLDPSPDARRVLAVSAAAWIALAVWAASPAAPALSHEQLDGPFRLAAVAGLAAGWTLMVLAMMLPTTTPLLALVPGRRTAVLAGYVAAWLAVGLALHAGDRVLHEQVDAHPWLLAHPELVLAATVAVAGLHQRSTSARRCLDRCRRPQQAMRPGAVRTGLVQGRACVGSCWGLMLVAAALGMGALGAMVVLAAVVLVETRCSWGPVLVAPVGSALLVSAVLLAARALV